MMPQSVRQKPAENAIQVSMGSEENMEIPRSAGVMPKQQMSHRESNWIPNFLAGSLRFTMRATVPSNISLQPASIKQKIDH